MNPFSVLSHTSKSKETCCRVDEDKHMDMAETVGMVDRDHGTSTQLSAGKIDAAHQISYKRVKKGLKKDRLTSNASNPICFSLASIMFGFDSI